MNIFAKKWGIALVTAGAVAASGFVLEHFIGFNPITTAVNLVASPIKDGFAYIAHSLEDGRDFIWEMRAYKADNKKLEAENLQLKRESRDIASYRDENERLRGLLGLKDSLEGHTTVAASVISHSSEGWSEKLEINRGSANGIAADNIVITPDGLVGRVTEAGVNYAVITTILDRSAAVGIKVSRTGGNGLVEGDTDMAKDMQCKLSFVDNNTSVIVGDVVETSGTSGIYPPGFIVGRVMSISADSAGMLNYAVIDPAVDMDNLKEVLVITG